MSWLLCSQHLRSEFGLEAILILRHFGFDLRQLSILYTPIAHLPGMFPSSRVRQERNKIQVWKICWRKHVEIDFSMFFLRWKAAPINIPHQTVAKIKFLLEVFGEFYLWTRRSVSVDFFERASLTAAFN